jgi:hypothetical protein
MKTKTYIIFYQYYKKDSKGKTKSEGCGFVDDVKITKRKEENIDVIKLNKLVTERVEQDNFAGSFGFNYEVIITNIVNQKEI